MNAEEFRRPGGSPGAKGARRRVKLRGPVLVRASSGRRRMVYVAPMALALAVGVAFIPLRSALLEAQQLVETNPQAARQLVFQITLWTAAAVAAVVAPLACYCLWLANRVWKNEQYPPPGAKLFWDAYYLKGAAARSRGVMLYVMGVGLLLLLNALWFLNDVFLYAVFTIQLG